MVDAARDHLLSLQHDAGWWQGNLETNVTMDAEDLMLRQFLGIRDAEQTEQVARWIRSQQRADGTWANFYEGPADLSTTVEAYVALRLAGDDPDAEHMRAAASFVLGAGGIEATRVFTRMWLALFGEWSWDDLPIMPPELIFLPSWFPLNIYDWGCWARQTVVPLTIVNAIRPVRPLGVRIDELRSGHSKRSTVPPLSVGGLFEQLDKLLHVYQRSPVKPLRRMAIRQAAEWVVAHQEADGGWGGIQPPWVYSIIALHLMGYQLDHPVLAKAIAGLDGFTVHEETEQGTV
ncbi:MAG TPA: prenyltransferase/squalene oxidase repeat-containing protein, partial [Pseudonocardiaceae bacterium]